MNRGFFGRLRRTGRILLLVGGVFFSTTLSAHAAKASDYAAVFDAAYYAEHHADVRSAYGNNGAKLLAHFLTYGMAEGRQANAEFNADAYRARYADLNDAYGDDKKQYYLHYLHYGKKEGRIATVDGTAAGMPVAPQSAVQVEAQESKPAAVNSRQPVKNGDNWRSIPGTDDPSYEKAAAVLQTLGWNITKAFYWSAGLTYYGHGKADMPENGDPGTHWFADFGFDNRKGNCYVMAATFYEFAKLCGYSPRQMTGYVPKRAGGIGPHSWVEIDLDGQTYVYDPDYTYGTGKNGFKIQYGQSGTWRYQNYQQMRE